MTTQRGVPVLGYRTRLLIYEKIVYYDASSCLEEKHLAALKFGEAVEYVPEGDEIEWEKITHVFTNNMDFPGKQDAAKQDKLAIVTVIIHF